jgi:hypothetical protein
MVGARHHERAVLAAKDALSSAGFFEINIRALIQTSTLLQKRNLVNLAIALEARAKHVRCDLRGKASHPQTPRHVECSAISRMIVAHRGGVVLTGTDASILWRARARRVRPAVREAGLCLHSAVHLAVSHRSNNRDHARLTTPSPLCRQMYVL